MIGALLLTALLAQTVPDPCAPVPALDPDRVGAAAYQAIGDEERVAGRPESAAAAYRAALARDPSSGPARAGLDALCSARRRDEALARGLELFRAGKCSEALEPLGVAHAQGDRTAALLEGICLYRAGDDDRAAAALRDAEQDPGTSASARLFLGLLALRRGRPAEAAPLLDSAAADPLLAPVAQGLSRDLQRQGLVVLSVLAEGGWDSNADLTPGASLAPAGAGDGFVGGAAVLSTAPWGDDGPYARAAAVWRDQFRENSLDLVGLGAAAGFQLGRARRHLLLECGYDNRRLGGKPYLSAPRLLGEARLGLGDKWSTGAWYALRRESFQAGLEDYSGWRHAAQADLTGLLARRVLLTAAWQAGADRVRTPLSYREHGPVLAAALPVGARARLVFGAGWTWRSYNAADPDLGRRRADCYADLAGRAELDVATRWTVQLAVAGRRAYSNVPDFRYARLVSTLGLSWTLGIP